MTVFAIAIAVATCVAFGQSAAQPAFASRLDAVVRSMMPEWVLDQAAVTTHDPADERRQVFRWRKQPGELGGDLGVSIREFDDSASAERQLQQTISRLSIGAIELPGVGDHAYHARMGGADAPRWRGTIYARVDRCVLTVSGAKDGADVRSIAAALAMELRRRTK